MPFERLLVRLLSSFWLVRVGERVSAEGMCSLSVSCVYKKTNTSRGWPSSCTVGPVGDPQVAGSTKGLSVGSLRPQERGAGGSERHGLASSFGFGAHLPSRVSTQKRVKPSLASRPRCLGRCVDSVLGGGGDSRLAISVFLLETVGCARRSSLLPKRVRAQTLLPWLLAPSVSSVPPPAPPLA